MGCRAGAALPGDPDGAGGRRWLSPAHPVPLQVYESGSNVDQFVTRFLLKETANQTQSLLSSVESAVDAIDEQTNPARSAALLPSSGAGGWRGGGGGGCFGGEGIAAETAGERGGAGRVAAFLFASLLGSLNSGCFSPLLPPARSLPVLQSAGSPLTRAACGDAKQGQHRVPGAASVSKPTAPTQGKAPALQRGGCA